MSVSAVYNIGSGGDRHRALYICRVNSISSCSVYRQWGRQLWGTGVHAPPRLPTISFLVHFGVNMTANYSSIV